MQSRNQHWDSNVNTRNRKALILEQLLLPEFMNCTISICTKVGLNYYKWASLLELSLINNNWQDKVSKQNTLVQANRLFFFMHWTALSEQSAIAFLYSCICLFSKHYQTVTNANMFGSVVRYNTKYWYGAPSEVHKCRRPEDDRALRALSNCEQRTCSTFLLTDCLGRGSNMCFPCNRPSGLTN